MAVIFEDVSSTLLTIHLIMAIGLIVSVIASYYIVLFQVKKDSTKFRTFKLASLIGMLLYFGTWFLGIAIYPVFKVNVMVPDFDPNEPILAGLFEIKEHVGGIAVIPALAVVLLHVFFDLSERENLPKFKLAMQLQTFVTFAALFKMIMGFIFTAVHSI